MKYLLLLLFPTMLLGQSAQRWNTAITKSGGNYATIIPNAQISVCTYNSLAQCSTPQTVYSDQALTAPLTQPFPANAFGVYSYYVQTGTRVVEKVCSSYSQCNNTIVQIGNTGGGSGSGVSSVSGDGSFYTNNDSVGGVTLSLGSTSAHYIWGNHTGSAGVPNYGALVSGDIPNNGANTTGYAGGLAGGSLGSIPYQSSANTTSYVSGQTTTGHAYFLGEEPTGSLIAPQLYDLGSYIGTNITANSPLSITTTALGISISCSSCASSTYPGAGLANSTGSGWGTSYTVGNSGSDIPQLSSGLLNSSVIPAINLAGTGAGGVTGNLQIANFNGGTGASGSTVWCGNGTWCTPAGSITGQIAGYGVMAATATTATSYLPFDYNITNSGDLTAHVPVVIAGTGPGVISYTAGNASSNPIPTCSSSMSQPWPTATVTDSTSAISGATYVSGGSNFAFVACNGSSGTWIVLGGGSGGGGGNPTFVSAAGVVGAYSVNPSSTVTLSITTGNTLVLWGLGINVTAWNTPSGCVPTWTAQGSPTTGSSGQSIWTGVANVTGSCTVTVSGTSTSYAGMGGVLEQISNATTTGIVLSSYGTASCSSSCTGSSLTTTAANSLVLTFIGIGAGVALSAPSPFSFDINATNSAGATQAGGHYTQASAGLYTPTWTTGTTENFINVSVALQ
jgi:hypothetical protein